MTTPCDTDVWGPCQPLITTDDLCGDCKGIDLNDADNLALFEAAIGWATERFIMATRGRFRGCCTTTFRPAPGPQGCLGSIVPELAQALSLDVESLPLLVAGGPEPVFINCWSGQAPIFSIPLPYLPVREVTEVMIDGAVFDPANYFLQPGTNTLVRTDGEQWPNQQLPTPLADQPGTWSITEVYGLGCPPSAKPLLAMYACELAKRCTGQDCDLPEGVRIKSRPGVEYDDRLDIGVLDVDYRLEGYTGYGALDDWIRQLHGGHAKERPRMFTGRPRHEPHRPHGSVRG